MAEYASTYGERIADIYDRSGRILKVPNAGVEFLTASPDVTRRSSWASGRGVSACPWRSEE
jgi:hypothetical protein